MPAADAADDAAPDAVTDVALDDLRARLHRYRAVPRLADGWRLGADPDVIGDLVRYWADAYDWRAAEARIRALPWVRARSGLRAVRQRAASPAAPAVVLLHGWPDQVLRFARVLPMLTDLHVVVPALPGFPFSGLPAAAAADMAEPVADLMAELGHDRYVVSGGDIGTTVAETLARRHPDRVAAIHLTDIPYRALLQTPEAERSADERAYLAGVQAWQQDEGAYSREQSTKPDTLSVGLGDSPAGLLAWLVEKLRSWSDCGGDVERVFPRDELLTWVAAYWFTGTIGTSFGPYGLRRPPESGRVRPPLVATLFPKDIWHPTRSVAERTFDVRGWRTPAHGGHFGAWEQPAEFAAGLREAVDLS